MEYAQIGSSALSAPEVLAVDSVDQSINTVFVCEALRVTKLIRVAANVLDERCPVKRAAEVVGDGWTFPSMF
jgi:hypothetical protein